MKPDIRYENGKQIKSVEYIAWVNMRRRCRDPKQNRAERYVGRGIMLHPAWSDFGVFLADVGLKPSADMSLDRIDNNGNYEPGNVRWATPTEQNRNRSFKTPESHIFAKRVGIKPDNLRVLVWQVREKDRGGSRPFGMSPAREALVREYMASYTPRAGTKPTKQR